MVRVHEFEKTGGATQPGHVPCRPLGFVIDTSDGRRGQPAWGTFASAGTFRRRSIDSGDRRRLDDESPRGDHGGHLGVAELTQKTEEVAVDRFAPCGLAGAESTADADGADAFVEGGSVEGEAAAFSVAAYTEGRVSLPAVEQSEERLQLVAKHMAPQLVGGAVDELAVRHVGSS
mgnify:CR=1 FL=1